jgi:hypothetical protein
MLSFRIEGVDIKPTMEKLAHQLLIVVLDGHEKIIERTCHCPGIAHQNDKASR